MSFLQRLQRHDWVLLILPLLFIAWTWAAASLADHSLPIDSPMVWAPAALAVGVVVGRLAGWVPRVILGALLALAVGATARSTITSGGGPLAGPLGYANANAALGIQLAALACVVAVSSGLVLRLLMLLVALGALAIPVLNTSTAAVGVSVLLIVGTIMALAGWGRRAAWPAGIGAGLTAVGAALTWFMATLSTWPAVAYQGLSEARHTLWGDAVALWKQSPLVGSGPGSFEEFSELAKDPDTTRAHSSVLQVAAESGLIGVILFAALLGAGFFVTARVSARLAWVASAALAALCLHSFTDYIFDFPALMVTAGAVVGLASAARMAPEAGRARPRPHRSAG
ncbi:MAG: O-antigen ligase family protein [Propionibacteriaceae bacterium]|nr:O-antigen ligase family protein [Propionibacteriaceae bacterium]